MTDTRGLRIAKFKVDYHMLGNLMEMPSDATILRVDDVDGRSCWFTVTSPELPMASPQSPPEISPTVTREVARWDWGVRDVD